MAATPLACADWGLWPKSSLNLVGMLAQSRYSFGRTSYESTDLDILAIRLSQTCKLPVDHALITPGSMNEGEGTVKIKAPSIGGGISYIGGPDAVAAVGAWRKILGLHL